MAVNNDFFTRIAEIDINLAMRKYEQAYDQCISALTQCPMCKDHLSSIKMRMATVNLHLKNEAIECEECGPFKLDIEDIPISRYSQYR